MEYELQKLFYEIKQLQEKENHIVEGFKKANLLDNAVAISSTAKIQAYKEVLNMIIPTLEKVKQQDERNLKYIEALRNKIKELQGEQE